MTGKEESKVLNKPSFMIAEQSGPILWVYYQRGVYQVKALAWKSNSNGELTKRMKKRVWMYCAAAKLEDLLNRIENIRQKLRHKPHLSHAAKKQRKFTLIKPSGHKIPTMKSRAKWSKARKSITSPRVPVKSQII